MTTPYAKWKAAERARRKAAGLVAVTHYIHPDDRERLRRYVKRMEMARYVKRLAERTEEALELG